MKDTTFVDVPVVDQWHIPDDLWEGIALLLPEHKNTHRFGGGRPRTPDRVCMEAILFVLRTGCQWKALNATRFCPGPPPTIASRNGSQPVSSRRCGRRACWPTTTGKGSTGPG